LYFVFFKDFSLRREGGRGREKREATSFFLFFFFPSILRRRVGRKLCLVIFPSKEIYNWAYKVQDDSGILDSKKELLQTDGIRQFN